MATSGPTSLPAYLSNDADFRSWADGVHDAIISVGLVQSADTGQIDFATVTKPGAANTAAGYAIYTFDDTLQATAPCFIKIEYGTGGAVDRPGMWVTGGTSSNGSGTLSGLTTRKALSPSQSKTAGTTLSTYVSGTSSRLSLVTNYDTGSTAFAMGIFVERLRNPSGTETDDGLWIYATANNQILFQLFGTSGGITTAQQTTAHPFFLDASKQVTTVGGDTAIVGAHIAYGTWYRTLLCSVDDSDLTSGTAVTVTNLGTNHTILPLVQLYKLAGTMLCIPWE